MLPRPPSSYACLAWLLTLLVLACRPSTGPITPLAPPAPRTAEALPPPPPVSLTASDGTGLALASLHARAVIDEPLALTELELAFDNPRYETIEGRFELLLPPGARVTRFALQVNGQWQEAEVVERLTARQVYEVALYEGRDPALLERDTGNRFGARVFPITPHERKHVLVSYVQEFADPTEPWRLGIRGLPPIETLELEAHVVDPAGGTRRTARSLPWQAPTSDFVVPRDAPHDDGVRHGEQVVARIQPLAGVDLGEAAPLEQLTVLVDTSASRALDFDASLASLGRVLQALARHAGAAKLRVLAFDQEVVPIYSGSLIGFGPEALAALHARRPLGASDLGLALRALEDGEHPRVLLVSDGLVSAGEQSDAALRRQLQGLASRGVERLDALVLGRVRDEERLRRLVAGPLPRAGVLLRSELPPERAAARLVQPTLEDVRISVPGARWWSPTRIDGLQPEDHVLVYAELPADQPLRVQVAGPVHRDLEVPLRTTESPLHEHGWRRAQIEGLVQRLAALQDELESERLRRHVIALSVRHRIVNDLTALLVLESDEDYARFGLDRRGLEDVLAVGPSGAEVLRRREPEPAPEPEPEPAPAPTAEPSDSPSPPAAGGGQVTGVVAHEGTREPIAGALVVLQCTCLPGQREVVTDERGLYGFNGLPPGQYTIQVLSGQADVSKMVELPLGARFRANFSINPDTVRRMMVVTAEPRGSARRRERRERRKRSEEDTGAGGGFGFGVVSKPSATTPVALPADPPPPPPDSFTQPVPEPPASQPAASEPAREEPAPEEPTDAEAPTLDGAKTPQPDQTVAQRIVVEEFRNVPVGASTSRDFTAAVETTATASRDAAGIRLAGTTGAESKYVTEGISLSSSLPSLSSRFVAADVHLRRPSIEGVDRSRHTLRSMLRWQLGPVEECYFQALASDSELRGRIELRLQLDRGKVTAVGKRDQVGLDDPELLRCLDRAVRTFELPDAATSLTYTLVFHPNDGPPTWFSYARALDDVDPPIEPSKLGEVEVLIERRLLAQALAIAREWRERAPIDVTALVAVGHAARAHGDLRRAARAYGSIIDLYPSRADMLRFAAGLLESLDDPAALDLAIDAYRRAVAERPDHPTGHRNLALALLRRGEPQAAFEALEQALRQPYPPDRFAGVQRVLHEDLGIIAAVWLHREPARAATIEARLAALSVPLATAPSIRIVLTWESDVSDVDLDLTDAATDEPPPGAELVADVTTGFGPEAIIIADPPARARWDLRVHYYARGPMGYGMGKVAVLHHDGAGGLRFEDRPFVAIQDDQWLQLGPLSPQIPASARTPIPAPWP